MNIEMQSCGLLMLLILYVILTREKSLDLTRRRKFKDTILSCIACLIMDIVSVIAIVYASQGRIPESVAFVLCKVYLVLLVNVGYRGFLYAASEFFDENTHKVLRNTYRIIILIDVLAILILPIDIHYDGIETYSYGPSTIAAYILAVVILASTTSIAMYGGKNTPRRRRRAIILWQMCWVVAALVQFIRPDLLVISFAAAFGIVLIYAELESPNQSMDRATGQFSSNALYTYLIDLYKRNEPFSAMHISVDYSAGNFDIELEREAIRRIAYFLDNDKTSYVFRESDRDFVVIYKSSEKMQADYERAQAGLQEAVGLPVGIAYTLIPDNSVLKGADEFMQFQHFNLKNAEASNCIIAGREITEEMREYLHIRDQISWALANDAIEVFYQPIYEVERKAFTSAEALMRIRDSEGNLVLPGKFIPIAEENGLIVPLGREIFKRVCGFLARGEAQKLGIEYIEINLSMAQFSENEPAGFVQQVLEEYDIDPGLINLEITETADPTARQTILKNMNTLIDKGVHFSLDDFGTGRSNIDYFVVMPVSLVKFDHKFTHWYFESEKARDVIESVVAIIDRMKLPIVMEGIETEEELNAMVDLGASYIQGFYFSKPLPEEEFLDYLRKNHPDEV